MIHELVNGNKQKISYLNFHNFDFYRLSTSARYNDNSSFIHRDGLLFEDYIGCMNLAGNELYCYPALANSLRQQPEYPIIKRCYPINETLKGKAFIKYFYKRFNRCYWEFKKQQAALSCQVNNLIYLYGQERQIPIITSFKEREIHQGKLIEGLVINGVDWFIATDWNEDRKKQTECLNLRKMLAISNEYYFTLEIALMGTPFMGIRIKRHHKQKGQIKWYCLDTLQTLTKNDIATWQKG
jgi:hypothetical protein